MKKMLTVEQLNEILFRYLDEKDLLSIEDFEYMLEEFGTYYSPEGWVINE